MAPSKATAAPYSKDERVLCFHHEMLYEAKVLDTRPTEDAQSWQYKIHYKGWKNTWDDWVPQDRVRKLTDENKELASQLHAQMKALQQKQYPYSAKTKKGGRANGSDFSSARGSEERHTSVAAQTGRGPRRNRDYDLEQAMRRHYIRSSITSTSLYPGFGALHGDDLITSEHMTASITMTGSALVPASQGNKTPLSVKSSPLSVFSRSPSPPSLVGSPSSSARLSSGPSEVAADIKQPPAKRRKVSLADGVKTGSHATCPGRRSNRLSSRHPFGYAPKHTDGELVKWLKSESHKIKDPLTKRPLPGHSYIDHTGKLRDPYKYDFYALEPIPHPAIKLHTERGTITSQLRLYYSDIPHDVRLPFAGVIHENLFNELFREQVLTKSDFQEEGFHARPSIKLVIPDHLKAILVDDWENVTKNQQLVPLPTPHPVNSILSDYLAAEKPKRQPGSAQADILEEVVAGLREYFEKCLGRILLYRFERNQYLEMRELWAGDNAEWAGKSAGDMYGAEHFCRLLVTLPELIAQTNMDQQSVNRLREELAKLTNWLGKNATTYFVNEYETPSQSYIEKARGY